MDKNVWWIVGAVFVVFLATLAGIKIKNDKEIDRRISIINNAGAAIASGKARGVVLDREGKVSEDLLQAIGTPLDEQPQRIQEAFEEVLEAALARGRSLYRNPSLTGSYQSDLEDLISLSGTTLAPSGMEWTGTIEKNLSSRKKFFERQSPSHTADLEGQLSLVVQGAQEASSRGDLPFLKCLQDRQMEVWSTLVGQENEGLVERVKVIRRLTQSLKEQKDGDFRLRGKSFLGAHLMEAMGRSREEEEIVNRALISIEPSLRALQESGLRFDVTIAGVTTCGSGDQCKNSMERLEAALLELDKITGERQPIVRATLQEIIETASLDEKAKIWVAMLNALEGSYLFTVEPTSWPGDLAPLPVRVKRVLQEPSGRGANFWNELIDRFSGRPIYGTEMKYLLRAKEVRWAHCRLAENIHLVMASMKANEYRFPLNRFDIISERFKRIEEEPRVAWDVVSLPSGDFSSEATHLRTRLADIQRNWLSYATPGGPSVAAVTDELRSALLLHCQALGEVRPKECSP